MPFTVLLTDDAARDLEDLYDYISRYDVPGKAAHVLEHIENLLNSLSETPRRGVYPRELIALGLREYREISSNPTVSSTALLKTTFLYS